ncbi:MAG: mycofactocin biosynthesis chaperone MftB [Microbacterium sp.]|uniref:mycofactocin biosynthesis chaperone MftB n=1 Tax=Microbacterium sp. TaxID=51671 RepID=UPI002724DB30|nr:mycofactocin biosynthesis chaperone MftB [Microbacterium sp.]MDO8383060.1 mycofactocin biosynthesis chaperone MftB [Microbacterium sp.]
MFDPDAGWTLSEQVSVRPEPFGALLYHFGTRKLSFLKDRTLLSIVTSLSASPSARTACVAVGVADEDQARYLRALGTLAESRMIERRRIEEHAA